MNCLIVISHGSGCEMMSVSLIRELVKTNKYSSIYVTAVNKYFADCLKHDSVSDFINCYYKSN